MDFGFLYIPNKAASQAAMGLGCFVVVFLILIPYIVCWAFVPLYITVLIMGVVMKFQLKEDFSQFILPFLLPLAPFAMACLLCLFFWWAIPTVVNAIDEILALLNPWDEPMQFRDTIPDDKCYLYFILIFGGSIGSIASMMIIESLWKEWEKLKWEHRPTNDNRSWQEIWIEREFQRNDIRSKYVGPTYQAYETYKDKKIKCYARDFFSDELSKQFVDERIINQIWARVSWMFGDNIISDNNNRFYRLESARERQEKQRSLCIRASIDFTPKIKQLRKQFKDGVISREEAMKSLQDDFEKWKAEFDLSTNDSNVVCEFLRKKINI